MSKVALITGGQSGIGLGAATALARSGARVALASLSAPDAPDVAAALAALGSGARYYPFDVRDTAGGGALLDRVEADLGPVTTFVSNAGVPARSRGDMLEVSPENFDVVLDVNLRGAFFLAQAVAARMAETPCEVYRAMIFVTSVSAELASIERAEYCISKAAAAMTAQLFALRMAPLGVGVFDLRPGIIETAMTSGVKAKYDARIADGLVPAGRWGQPSDIGDVVAAIADGRLAFATGAAIPVDGGLSIPRL